MTSAVGGAPATSAVALSLAVAVAVVLGAFVGGLAPPASAGDTAALFSLEPSEVDADAGETVAVDVVLQSNGGYADAGVESASFTLEYDPAVVSVTAVDAGPFLAEGSASADLDRSIDEEAGTATVTLDRTPAGEGATGVAGIATVSLEIVDDAPATATALSLSDTETVLVSEHPQPTIDRDATVLVGGADEADAIGRNSTADEPSNVTFANDSPADAGDESNGTDEAAGEPNETDEAAGETASGGDSIPGFAAPVALVGVALALAVAVWTSISTRERS